MKRMDRTAVRKLDMNSPDFEEANMCLCEGSPQECWDHFWEMGPIVSGFSNGEIDFFKPLRRDVAQKIYRPCKADV
jgi:hypothetical protein